MTVNLRKASSKELNPNQIAQGQPLNANALAQPDVRASDHQIFRDGEIGRLHALAHECGEAGDSERGLQRIGNWLGRHSGAGSKWVHLHFHVMLFEIDLGRLTEAHDRLLTHILPGALNGKAALTDGPAAMWWLQMALLDNTQLPWTNAALNISAHIRQSDSSFVRAHELLVYGGARDEKALQSWRASNPPRARVNALDDLAHVMILFARSRFGDAASAMEKCLPSISALGGSNIQNNLFARLPFYFHERSLLDS